MYIFIYGKYIYIHACVYSLTLLRTTPYWLVSIRRTPHQEGLYLHTDRQAGSILSLVSLARWLTRREENDASLIAVWERERERNSRREKTFRRRYLARIDLRPISHVYRPVSLYIQQPIVPSILCKNWCSTFPMKHPDTGFGLCTELFFFVVYFLLFAHRSYERFRSDDRCIHRCSIRSWHFLRIMYLSKMIFFTCPAGSDLEPRFCMYLCMTEIWYFFEK